MVNLRISLLSIYMIKTLPDELDQALRIISNDEQIGLKAEVINTLLDQGYITYKYGGGWMSTSKGRRYLKENNNKT